MDKENLCLPGEIWKDIPDFIGLYQISNLKRVKSLTRIVLGRNNKTRCLRDKILNPMKTNKNSISLRKDETNFTLHIPSLLKEAFGYTLPDLENEIWKEIKGYEGLYKVSNMGRIKSFHKFEKLLILTENYEGYPQVKLYKNKKKKTIPVHRIVAIHFIPNPNNLPVVHHRNNIKNQNNIKNLTWVTDEENRKLSLKDKRCDYSFIKKSNLDMKKIRKNHKKTPKYYTDENFHPKDEIWIQIKDFAYKISNYGRLKRIYKNHERFVKPTVHKQDNCSKFPLMVRLYKNWIPKTYLLHRLVGLTFIKNPNNLSEINHKNGDKFHNHVSNLEWSTHQDNMNHAWEMGLIDSRGEQCSLSKLTNKIVLKIRKDYKGKDIPINKLSKTYNVCRKTIVNIIQRKTWKHI